MSKNDIKREIEEEEKMSSGEGTVGSGSVDLEADDDAVEALSEVVGHDPKGNLADEVEEAENDLRGKPVHQPKDEE